MSNIYKHESQEPAEDEWEEKLNELPRSGVDVGLHYQDTEHQNKRLQASLERARLKLGDIAKAVANQEDYLERLMEEIK